MGSCADNTKQIFSGCDYGTVSGNCRLTMNGAGCESGILTLEGVSGNGKVTIEQLSKNITDITISYISGNGEVIINGHNSGNDGGNDGGNDSFISKIEFDHISGNGKMYVESDSVNEIQGRLSGNGYACINDSDYNKNTIVFLDASGNGKFEKCGVFSSYNTENYFWFLFLVVLPMCYVFYEWYTTKKAQKSSAEPSLPITGTTEPSAPNAAGMATPVPSKYQEPEIKLQAEPEINLQVEPETNPQAEPAIAYASPVFQTANPNVSEELQKLKNMHDMGVLTTEEFQTAKAKLLN